MRKVQHLRKHSVERRNPPHALDHHTWGCPVFVLEAQNHSGLGTPKREPQSRVGVYLGHSPCHAGSVALVLNLRTGHVSPQFHVIFDDDFTTIDYLASSTAPPNWDDLFKTFSELATDEQFDLAERWKTDSTLPTFTPEIPLCSLPDPPREQLHDPPREPSDLAPVTNSPETESPPTLTVPTSSEPQSSHDAFIDLDQAGLRRSTCQRSSVERLTYGCLALLMMSITSIPPVTANCFQSVNASYNDFLENNFDGTTNASNPILQMFQATITDNETYTMKEMLQQPNKWTSSRQWRRM